MPKTSLESPFQIYKLIKANRTITIIGLSFAGIISLMNGFIAYKMFAYNSNNALVITHEGDVMPTNWIARNEIIHIEIKDHLHKFYSSYHTYDFNNVDQQREKAAFLIHDESLSFLENKYTDWFSSVQRSSVQVKAIFNEKSFLVSGASEPYSFQSNIVLEIKNGPKVEYYKMQSTGDIALVSADYPRNPHGLLIYNYKESDWELQDNLKTN
ncbi:MAG: hypothetical protein AAF620_01100 [Bacteroidota bacterium]